MSTRNVVGDAHAKYIYTGPASLSATWNRAVKKRSTTTVAT
jgi:hypothetical protein